MSVNFPPRKCKDIYISIPLTVNGITYNYPELGDEGWGSDAERWALAVTQSALFKSGGLFALTGEVDFGPSFGLKSIYYKSRTANIASAGQVRLANIDTVQFRNSGNSSNLTFGAGSSDANPAWAGVDLVTTATLATSVFNDITFTNEATPANPSGGNTKIFVDIADGHTKQIDSGGLVIDLAATSTVPGGATTELQYNNAGAFGGMTDVTWNGTDTIAFATGSTLGPNGNGLELATAGNNTGLNGTGTIRFWDYIVSGADAGFISAAGGGGIISIGSSTGVSVNTLALSLSAFTVYFAGSPTVALNNASGAGGGTLFLDNGTINVDGANVGVSGSFVAGAQTVTVTKGIITSIV